MNLNLIQISRQDGQEQLQLPGLYIAGKPRRPARGRRLDRLILYLELFGKMTLPPEQQTALLDSSAQTYFKTPGSVTTAMRKVAEGLNQQLLDLNLKSSDSGIQAAGLLSILTLRGDDLYLALCGPMQAFLITSSDAEQIYDSDSARRGLGTGRTTPIYFSQTNLQQRDTLLISYNPPPNWSVATLSSLPNYDPQNSRQYLLNLTKIDFTTILLQAAPGSGEVQLLQPLTSSPAPIPIAPSKDIADESALKRQEESQTPEAQEDSLSTLAGGAAVSAIVSEQVELTPEPDPQEQASTAGTPATELPTSASTTEPVSAPRQRTTPLLAPFFAVLVSFSEKLGAFFANISRSTRTWLARLLPDESILTLPSSVMIFFAIAVPLIVVSIATVVYFQRGRTGQYQANYAQAVQAAGFARNQDDPQARIDAWNTVLSYLDKAETYQVTAETEYLRSESQFVLDEVNKITRLNYQPAIVGGLDDETNITRMYATERDLFLLNSSDGNVSRAIKTAQGYEMDLTFQCGPGYPAGRLEPFIDIAITFEGSDRHATVLALDGSGNLIACVAGEAPRLVPLASPPTTWGQPIAIYANLGNLYILDPESNAVWVYRNGNYGSPPQLFFDEEIPPLQDAIDLVVDKDDLYLLHTDGRITLCVYSQLGVAPTRCQDPVPYVDTRPGRENQMMLPEPPFTQILATQPPDPSIFLFQLENQAIYHFTMRLLTYQRQFRPQDIESAGVPPEEPATAFSLSPDSRVAFLAVGNQVLYAGLP